MSFPKNYDDSIAFFVLDQSVLDGPDLLGQSDSDVIQPWDKYDMSDYSERIISLEWQREESFPYSVNMAMADVVFNNTDDFFTPNSGSPISSYILPKRPIRLQAGFNGEALPAFVGLTEKMPVINENTKQASFHCIDFLSSLFLKPLNQSVMYQDMRVDEILGDLLESMGILSSQYSFDPGLNRIAFAYFEKGMVLGDAIRKLMQSELGSFYMDETGMLRFVNLNKRSPEVVYHFNESNTISIKTSDESEIINVVEINAKVREVQVNQAVYNLPQAILVPAGSSEDFFFDFQDPVTGIDDIEFYTANTESDGTGDDITSSVTVTDTDLFATAVKVTFNNASSSNAYITSLAIYGTPAKVVKPLYYRDENSDSVAKYDEHILKIDNDYIQTEAQAATIATIALDYYSEFGSIVEIVTKGNPALQIGDTIEVGAGFISDNYVITKIVNNISPTKFIQTIVGKLSRKRTFFTLDVSELDSTDVLAP